MSKEAMKLALEALEGAEALLLSMGLTHLIVYGDAEKAITALREALAEQPAQQEPVALKPCWYESKEKTMCRKCGQIHAEAIPTAAQQEPLGYLYELIVEGQVVNEKFTSVNWDTRYEPFGRNGVDHGGEVTKTPLYTSPPAQPGREALEAAHTRLQKRYGELEGKAQRTWVGLTNEELRQVWYDDAPVQGGTYIDKLRQVEAKLKEKNT